MCIEGYTDKIKRCSNPKITQKTAKGTAEEMAFAKNEIEAQRCIFSNKIKKFAKWTAIQCFGGTLEKL